MTKRNLTTLQLRRRRIAKVMQRERICSEHGAAAFIEAQRRDRAKKRKTHGL